MNTELECLVESYKQYGTEKSGEILLPAIKAINFSRDLELINVLILGVNVWYINKDQQIVEDPASLDLSKIKDSELSAFLVRSFIHYHFAKQDNKTESIFYSLVF